ATIDGRLGGSFEVLSGPFHWTGPILARDPPTLLAYEHNHEPCPEMPSGARTIVRWELSPEGEGTRPSDVYEWMPGRFFVLHTAYGRIGIMDVGGTEIISYDAASKTYRSHFFDSKGNISTHELTVQGDTRSSSPAETPLCRAGGAGAAPPSAAQLQPAPATCLVVALTRLKRLVTAIMRTSAASPCSS